MLKLGVVVVGGDIINDIQSHWWKSIFFYLTLSGFFKGKKPSDKSAIFTCLPIGIGLA